MNKEFLINILGEWGSLLKEIKQDSNTDLYQQAKARNGWFTPDNIDLSLRGLQNYLSPDKLHQWMGQYEINHDRSKVKKIGIVMAGNIPLVGFQDLLCTIVSGNIAQVKMSSQDNVLMPHILDLLKRVDTNLFSTIEIVDRLNKCDAVIATGSDNTSRYFKYYFKDVPHIIRSNRTSVGILTGEESTQSYHDLGSDILSYFGLGCRNVSKLYVPENFEFKYFFESIQSFENISETQKYVNNYDYNKSIYLVNREDFKDNGFLMLKSSSQLVSPVSVVYYEYYTDTADLGKKINMDFEKIQCIVSDKGWFEGSIPFGTTQSPELWDYADNVDTMEFLLTV